MKVNFVLDMENALVGSGIYSSATRLATQLKEYGIQTDINGKNYPYDIYHFQTAFPQSLLKAKILACQIRKKYKIVMTGHTTIEDFRNSFLFSNKIDFALIPYLTQYYSYADYLIAVSDYNRNILLKYGYNPEKIRVISNGIDLTKNRRNEYLGKKAKRALGIGESQFLVITVGICIYRKAPDIFTDVAINTPDHEFMWIGKYLPLGSIAHSPYLREKFSMARNTNNLRFTGYVSKNTIDALWNAADIFLYVTREENQGIALLEGIAYGNVPIISDHPVFNWLTHEKDCLKGNSVEEYSENIYKLASDKSLYTKLQKQGQNTLMAHDINKAVKELADLYTEIS